MFDFWEMQKKEYDPFALINQISKANQFSWGKIRMNGDDNFAGGILESTDRNILMPNPA